MFKEWGIATGWTRRQASRISSSGRWFFICLATTRVHNSSALGRADKRRLELCNGACKNDLKEKQRSFAMGSSPLAAMLSGVADGCTDLVFDVLSAGHPATSKDEAGVSLIQHCAYYGDVSAIRFLLAHGEALEALGDNFDLNGASFHGHWQLCRFLLERGANVNRALPDTGETPLHAALCKTDRVVYDRVLRVLLLFGANPNCATKNGVETGSFMRDCRTKGETPLHRAAAFGDQNTIKLLVDAGA